MAEQRGGFLAHAWNLIVNGREDPPAVPYGPRVTYGQNGGMYRSDRHAFNLANERSALASIFNGISMDVALNDFRHVKLDENNRFAEYMNSSLNQALSVEANIDQTGRAFIQDAVLTMFEAGVVAIVPTVTSTKPNDNGAYDIEELRVGRIVEWYPRHVKVSVYDDRTGIRKELVLPKRQVGIVENPLYSVINEPNSTLKRLIAKLNMLDNMDRQHSAGKLDIIIQLPYVIKTDQRRAQAEQRRMDIETQLQGSKYGIAYTDGTERITQLNRPVDNTLVQQVKDLKDELYAQLGVTSGIFDGTADERTFLNYYQRTVGPIANAFVEEMRRKFLSKTARTQRQSIMYFRDPFMLVPVSELADIGDKLTRNAILSSNDIRALIGFKPSADPKAEELSNKNINPVDPAASSPPVAENDDGNPKLSDLPPAKLPF